MTEKNIKLLVNGEHAFPRILECIHNASQSIAINMFIWRDDAIGNRIGEAILEAADRGVKITIVKDKQGEVFEKSEENKQSLFHKRFGLWSAFKAKGFDIMYPMKGKAKSSKQIPNVLVSRLLSHPNIFIYKEEILNDHSKYYVFDDEILITGGINIEDKENDRDVEGTPYSDYMIELAGTDYVKEFKDQLKYGKTEFDPPLVNYIYNVKRGRSKIFNSKREILKLISQAHKSLEVVMAYIGDRTVTNKIIAKANKGVKVTIVLPQKANLQHNLNMKVLKKIMKKTNNSVEVYLCKRMLHAKLLRIDHRTMTVGSVNLNKAAMKRMFELNVLLNEYSQDFKQTLDDSIANIINESVRVNNYEMIQYKKVKAFIEQIA